MSRGSEAADLEAMVSAGSLDVEALKASLRPLLETGDERLARLDDAVRRASG